MRMSANYLYCIADGDKVVDFGKIGLEGKKVYSIIYKDIAAVVHDCSSKLYESDDSDELKSWIITHEKAIEAAWGKYGTVLPFGFDTIIIGNKVHSAEKNMKMWLKDDYERLRKKLNKFRGKAEFGVKIFWNPEIVVQAIIKENPEIKKLKEEMKARSRGFAYLSRQKLEMLLRKCLEIEAEKFFNDFYDRIKSLVLEIKVEKIKKMEDGKQMLMNLSCLLPQEETKDLGNELEKINNRKEFSVRFTGPWPPYSFV